MPLRLKTWPPVNTTRNKTLSIFVHRYQEYTQSWGKHNNRSRGFVMTPLHHFFANNPALERNTGKHETT